MAARSTLLLALALTAVTLFGAGAASATPPAPASGTFVAPPPAPVSFRDAGENCIVEIPDVFVLDGTLAGDLVLDFRIVFHAPCAEFPGLPANFRAPAEFTGSVTLDGVDRSGSFTGSFTGTIDAQGRAEGTLAIANGSGGLAGLHGVLELAGTPGVGGGYAGAIHFDA